MVVSVTVEGSVGPVKAMVRLGDSVGEAIATVLERYAREGRSPRLDPAASESFQLHHSHFSLHSKPTAWYHFFFPRRPCWGQNFVVCTIVVAS